MLKCTHNYFIISNITVILGFAELQTDLDELTGDLTGSRLPYQSLTSYILQSLFPGAKDHPTLHPPQVGLQSLKFTLN